MQARRYRNTLKGKLCNRKHQSLRRIMQRRGIYNHADLVTILNDCNRVCPFCKNQLPRTSDFEIDHIIPLSKHGRNEIENLMASCISCNRSKHDNDVISWCKEKGYDVPQRVLSYLETLKAENIAPFIGEESVRKEARFLRTNPSPPRESPP